MTTFVIIQDLDIIKDIFFCFFPCFVIIKENSFGFQTGEKTLGNSIIPTVTGSAHATEHFMDFEDLLESIDDYKSSRKGWELSV